MSGELVQMVRGLGSPRILVFGDVVLDRYAWGEAARISPEAPIPVLSLRHEESRPGAAANVASVLAHLGATVSCCGVVGDDAPGRELTTMIEHDCKGEACIVVDPSRPTTVKTRFIGYVQSAHRAMHHILRVDSEDTKPIAGKAETDLLHFLEAAVLRHDIILVSDYEKGAISERLMRRLVELARDAQAPVIVDPKLGRAPAFYAGVSLMTPNRYETQILTGVRIDDLDSMERAAQRLYPEVCTRGVLITLDRDGMFLYEGEGRGRHIPTQPREVYDVTGAGDMVVSVMTLLLAAGVAAADAADVANVAAGIEVGKVGAAPVSREEIIRELMLREGNLPAKLKTEEELAETLAEHRRRNQTVVFTNGCFDLLHIGHIELLKFARRQGDLLVVGLNSDASVQAIKGPTRPILGQRERAHVLAALEDVSYIVIFDDPSVQRLVEQVQPDILVKGGDYKHDAEVVGADFVKGRGGKVVRAPLIKGFSTTDIVSRILEIHGNEAKGGGRK